MVRKYFTIDEAEAIIPSVTRLLTEAQDLKEKLECYESVVLKRRIMTDGSVAGAAIESEILDSDLQRLKEAFYAKIEAMENIGCIIRSLDEGIIDFYARFQGEDVFLSWQQGERKIRYWHRADEPVTDRKRIIELR